MYAAFGTNKACLLKMCLQSFPRYSHTQSGSKSKLVLGAQDVHTAFDSAQNEDVLDMHEDLGMAPYQLLVQAHKLANELARLDLPDVAVTEAASIAKALSG